MTPARITYNYLMSTSLLSRDITSNEFASMTHNVVMATSSPPEILCQIFCTLITLRYLSDNNSHLSTIPPSQLAHHTDLYESSLRPVPVGGPRDRMNLSSCVNRALIRGVCRYWRDVVDSNPSFWTTIVYHEGIVLNQISQWMEYSKPVPIELFVVLPPEKCHSGALSIRHNEGLGTTRGRCTAVLEPILNKINRCKILQIISHCSIQTDVVLSNIERITRGNTLSHFGIHQMSTCDPGGTFRITPVQLLHEAHTLSTLELTRIPLVWMAPANLLTYVTSLSLHFDFQSDAVSSRWEPFRHFLSFAKQVRHLSITFSTNPRLSGPITILSLPQITHLTITLTQLRGHEIVLALIHTPNLIQLSLFNRTQPIRQAESGEMLDGLLLPTTIGGQNSTIARIKTLAISWTYIDDRTITLLFSRLASVEELILHAVDSHRGPENVISRLLHSSLTAEQDRREGRGYVVHLPQLMTINTCGVYGRRELYLEYSRQRLGFPLHLKHT